MATTLKKPLIFRLAVALFLALPPLAAAQFHDTIAAHADLPFTIA